MKAIVWFFVMFCAGALGQQGVTPAPYKYEAKEIPDVFCVPLRLLPLAAGMEPRGDDTITIGAIGKKHITLHERKYEVDKCVLENDGMETSVHILCKPDAVGTLSISIVYSFRDERLQKKCFMSIEQEPRDLSERTAIAVYMILLP